MVTFDKDKKPIIKTEARITYELSLGPAWHRFFEGLKEEKILGTKCPKCNHVLVPPRSFCSHCFVDMEEWVTVSSEGVLVSWVLTDYEYFGMPTKPPFINSLIRLDGADCNFLHLVGGFEIKDLDAVRKHVKTGMGVQAVWRDEKKGGIMDIMYFKPI